VRGAHVGAMRRDRLEEHRDLVKLLKARGAT